MAWVVIGLTVAALVGFLWLAARMATAGQGERRAAPTGGVRRFGRRAVALRRPEGAGVREAADRAGQAAVGPPERGDGHAAPEAAVGPVDGDAGPVEPGAGDGPETAEPDPTVTIARQLGATGGASTMGGPVFPFRTTADRDREREGEAAPPGAGAGVQPPESDRP